MPRKPTPITVTAVTECKVCGASIPLGDGQGWAGIVGEHVATEHPESYDAWRRFMVRWYEQIADILGIVKSDEPAPEPVVPPEPEPVVAMDLTQEEVRWLKRRRARTKPPLAAELTDRSIDQLEDAADAHYAAKAPPL